MKRNLSLRYEPTGLQANQTTRKISLQRCRYTHSNFGLVFFFFFQISIILQFQSYARETADIAENNANKIFGQLQSFATAITSVAIQTNNYGFPNVTVPHFDKRAQEIANLTGAEMIMFAPFVNQNEKEGWESYAVQHQDWISQDYVSLTLAPIVTCVPHLAKSHPLALSPTI